MTTQRRRPARTRRISDQWLQYVRGSVTLSAANTFSESTVNLPVVVAEGFVIEAHLVEFEMPAMVVADLGETDELVQFLVALTKATQTSVPNIADPNYIYGYAFDLVTPNARTAEQAPVAKHERSGSLFWQFPEPILLPFEQIFFGANTGGVAAAPTFRFRIGYKTIRLTTRQLPELIQAVT